MKPVNKKQIVKVFSVYVVTMLLGGIIVNADFSQIRRNQQNLVQQNVVQNREEVTLSQDERKFVTIRVKNTDSKLDLNKPIENAYINNLKNVENVRISFLKSI